MTEKISELLDNPEILNKKPIDALVVFGFGIQDDGELSNQDRMIELTDEKQTRLRLSVGAKLRVVAAAELFLKGQVEDIILTGGKVKENKGVKESEAELMKEYLKHILKKRWSADLVRSGVEKNVAENIAEGRWLENDCHILLEDKATNTIENFAFTTNFLDKNKNKYSNIALLSNIFHLARIMELAERLQVKGTAVAAEVQAKERSHHYDRLVNNFFDLDGNNQYREELFQALSSQQDEADFPKDASVLNARLGTPYQTYLEGENRWTKGLNKVPQYWLSNVRFIEDRNRLVDILKAQQMIAEILKQKGVENIDDATLNQLQEALASVERIAPPKEWATLERKDQNDQR